MSPRYNRGGAERLKVDQGVFILGRQWTSRTKAVLGSTHLNVFFWLQDLAIDFYEWFILLHLLQGSLR